MLNYCDFILLKSYGMKIEIKTRQKCMKNTICKKFQCLQRRAKAHIVVCLRNDSKVVWSIIFRKTFLRQSAANRVPNASFLQAPQIIEQMSGPKIS